MRKDDSYGDFDDMRGLGAFSYIDGLLEPFGPAAPSLLPWAATWATEDHLAHVAILAAAQSELMPFTRWPVVADAVAEVLARRAGTQPRLLRQLADALPPLAGYLSLQQAFSLVEDDARADVVGYAALADRGLRVRQIDPQWRPLLAADPPVPPLANFRLLTRLVAGQSDDPRDLLGSEAVYLLPLISPGREGEAWAEIAVAEIEDCLHTDQAWYPAALLAHAIPFLNAPKRSHLRDSVGSAPRAWADVLESLVGRQWPRWESAAAELAVSHPAMARLEELSRLADPDAVAGLAQALISRIEAEYGARHQDAASPDWSPPRRPPSMGAPVRIIDAAVDLGVPVRLSVPDDAAAADPAAGHERHVNVMLGLPGDDQPLPGEHVYRAGTGYELLVGIGLPTPGSLLPGDESRWPDQLLPPGGLWLQAALSLPAGNAPVVRQIYLPAEGESFTCDCPFRGEHESRCERRRWACFSVPPAGKGETLTGELVVYYGAAAVVAIGIQLSAGYLVREGSTAMLLGCLSSTFDDLDTLAERSASILSVPDENRLMVNGASIVDNPLAIAANAADGIALNARNALIGAHFEITGREFVSRLGPSFDKSQEDYEADLRMLAKLGADLFTRLFNSPGSDNEAAYALPKLIRHEAQIRGRPPMLQIIDKSFGERAVPWALIYDLPVGSDTTRYVMCPSVQEFGPRGDRTSDAPVTCPYPHNNNDDVLCPYGFWGLSSLIEQPVMSSPAGSVVCRDEQQLSWLVVADPSMTGDDVTRHLARLEDSAAGVHVNRPTLGAAADLAAALAPESMDVVYFYCHCGYVAGHPEAPADRYLKLGTFNVQPLDIARWARGWHAAGLRPHWPSRRPLMVLNGCHTAEFTSGTLNNFPAAFVQIARAAGVVGTEITVEQGFAAWVGENLLAFLGAGLSVGAALHQLRWALLRRGNVLGLAYTPFCLANLTLRPAGKD
jgi:hypothetical protein